MELPCGIVGSDAATAVAVAVASVSVFVLAADGNRGVIVPNDQLSLCILLRFLYQILHESSWSIMIAVFYLHLCSTVREMYSINDISISLFLLLPFNLLA